MRKKDGNKKGNRLLRILKRILTLLLVLLTICILGTLAVNLYMIGKEKKHILTLQEAAEMQDVDCVIVLGCSVKPDGKPSLMLADRLDRSVELYEAGGAVILMTGDHRGEYYNESNTMKDYVVARGVNSEDVFVDHAGYCTYDSIYRAKEVFGAEKVIIITQEYHLYRSMYIADALGMEVYGVPTQDVRYHGQLKRDIREIFARNKDFLSCIFKPEAEETGTPVSLDGNGDLTDEKSN